MHDGRGGIKDELIKRPELGLGPGPVVIMLLQTLTANRCDALPVLPDLIAFRVSSPSPGPSSGPGVGFFIFAKAAGLCALL